MKVILFFLLFTFSLQAYAQQSKLYAAKNERGIYVEHKVQPKENWYSVGRFYAISPKEIASFNGLSMDKGLSIGQLLNVPLNSNNFIQIISAVGIPVYHAVQPKEGLIKIANTYGLSLAGIKNLNGLTTDQVNVGYPLIIGYIGAANQNAVAPVPTPSSSNVNSSTSIAPAASVKTTLPTSTPAPAVNSTPQKAQPVAPPVTQKQTAAIEKTKEENPKSAPKVIEKPSQPKVSVNEVKPTAPSTSNYFATGFGQQAKEGKEQKLENPTYGLFKSSSGWQDGKYYILINDVVPGTIVKLTATDTGKTIHAKVLGAVPPGKESEGMQLRLSNAAVSALGMTEGENRSLVVVWYK
jgi:LysM repeat protein